MYACNYTPPPLPAALANQADHKLAFAAEMSLGSLPLDVMDAPLENAVEAVPIGTSPGAGRNASAAGAAAAPARLAARAAKALGLAPVQVRRMHDRKISFVAHIYTTVFLCF